MHYTEVASQLKAKHPEYANRDDKELVEKYVQRFPEKQSLISFEDYVTEDENKSIIPQDISAKDVGDYSKGVAQHVTQGAMWGQAPHVSGVLNEIWNTPSKLYRIKNKEDAKQFYKDLGKDYVRGRENLKEEMEEFAKNNPKTALASEIVGGLGGGGFSLVRGLGKGILRQLLKGGLEGSVAGGMYGMSNTKGKGVDVKGAGVGSVLGAGIGGLGGVGLPIAIKGIGGVAKGVGNAIGYLGRLWGKGVDKVAEKTSPVKYIKNPMREIQKAEEKAVVGKEPIIDVEGVEVKPNNTSASAEIMQTQNPLKEVESTNLPATKSRDILANPKNMDDAYAYGFVQDYLPEQNLVINTLKKDRNVLEKVASGEDIGRHFDKFGEDAVEKLKSVRDTVRKAENEAYKNAGITDDYMLDGNKFVTEVEDAINKFRKDARTLKADEDAGDKFLNDVIDEWSKNDGQISFGKLKTFTKVVNKLKSQVRRNQAKGDSSSEFDLWNNISRKISEMKNADKNLGKVNKMYSELSNGIENFEYATGLNFDKPKNFAKNIFTSARDRADGGVYEKALDDFVEILDKYDGTKILGDLPSKIRMAKVSYVLRPSVKDSKLSKDVKGAFHPKRYAERKLAEALVGKELSSEQYYRILAQKMLKGEITPQQLEGQFRKVRFRGMSEDESNELLVKYLLLGKEGTGTIPSILAKSVKSGIKVGGLR